MKAKEYADKYKLRLLNSETSEETEDILFNEFFNEFYETLKKRNVKTDKGFENTLNEFNLKWNKLVKLVPCLKVNGFKCAVNHLILFALQRSENK